MKRKFFVYIFTLLALFFSHNANAQKLGISTNAVDWCNYLTTNLTVTMSMGQHLSVGLCGKYNPWFFNKESERQTNHAIRSISLDLRYWPWHVYSGWWYMLKGQLQEYNFGNLYGKLFSEQGKATGVGLGAGYALMLGTHWNVDFGLGLWGGVKNYQRYDCSYCGNPIREGRRFFVLPDNVFVSFCYIF